MGAVNAEKRCLGSVSVGRIYFHLVADAVAVFHYTEHIVLCVSDGIPDRHVGINFRNFIGICQVHDLLDGMSGIVAHGTALAVQKRLPVIAARKRILAGFDQFHVADHFFLQKLMHFDVIVIVAVLMENREYHVVFLRGIDQILHHLRCLAQRFLAQNIEAMLQQIFCNRVMQV